MTKTRAALLTLIFIAFNWPVWAVASGGDNHVCTPGHNNIDSCAGQDGKDGEDGEDGKDGIDGIDGQDGRDGIDGINGLNGLDGLNGIDGKDGIVDYRIIHKWRNYSAAMQAIQIHLPQDSSQRFTLSGSAVDGATGVGAGYAYKFDRDDNLSITAGIGSAGGEEVGVLSVGFEFGKDRNKARYNAQRSEYYDQLERHGGEQAAKFNAQASRLDSQDRMIAELRRQIEVLSEDCNDATNRAFEHCVSK